VGQHSSRLTIEEPLGTSSMDSSNSTEFRALIATCTYGGNPDEAGVIKALWELTRDSLTPTQMRWFLGANAHATKTLSNLESFTSLVSPLYSRTVGISYLRPAAP